MSPFQPGEQVYVRLIFQSGVPIKNAILIFVHKEDKNEHIMFGFKSGDEDTPIQPTMGNLLDLAVTITKNTKPGEYLLEKINFETYSGRTLDPQGELPGSRFEVIPRARGSSEGRGCHGSHRGALAGSEAESVAGRMESPVTRMMGRSPTRLRSGGESRFYPTLRHSRRRIIMRTHNI